MRIMYSKIQAYISSHTLQVTTEKSSYFWMSFNPLISRCVSQRHIMYFFYFHWHSCELNVCNTACAMYSTVFQMDKTTTWITSCKTGKRWLLYKCCTYLPCNIIVQIICIHKILVLKVKGTNTGVKVKGKKQQTNICQAKPSVYTWFWTAPAVM